MASRAPGRLPFTRLTCRELVELVTEYLEGALSPAGRRRIERHLTRCVGCRSYLAQMRETIGMLARLDAVTRPRPV